MEISAFKFQMSVNRFASIQEAKQQMTFQKSKHYIIYYNFIQLKFLSVFHMYLGFFVHSWKWVKFQLLKGVSSWIIFFKLSVEGYK